MTSPAITVGREAHVYYAARLMTENGIKRLPVVDSTARSSGSSRGQTSCVRLPGRTQEIEHEIREDVILRSLWIEEPSVVVRVEQGEVRLSGKLERRADAELIEQFVARVPGVVSVNSTLRWSWDDRKASREGAIAVGKR